MCDIRECTGLIIRKNGEYLVGTILDSSELRWSDSPWDAWRTRIRAKARSIAEKTGGEIMLFNPVAAQMKEYEYEGIHTEQRSMEKEERDAETSEGSGSQAAVDSEDGRAEVFAS